MYSRQTAQQSLTKETPDLPSQYSYALTLESVSLKLLPTGPKPSKYLQLSITHPWGILTWFSTPLTTGVIIP